ncbi:hypothetical protein ADK57_13795 [Streptomyces sp. MMG1533]|nr:hypothetical protein ADK57_13795 [Streptomyces sp. MMG1533]
MAAIGGFLFGYDSAVINGAVIGIQHHADELVIKLPEQGVLVAQDLVYHDTHLFLGIVRRMTRPGGR